MLALKTGLQLWIRTFVLIFFSVFWAAALDGYNHFCLLVLFSFREARAVQYYWGVRNLIQGFLIKAATVNSLFYFYPNSPLCESGRLRWCTNTKGSLSSAKQQPDQVSNWAREQSVQPLKHHIFPWGFGGNQKQNHSQQMGRELFPTEMNSDWYVTEKRFGKHFWTKQKKINPCSFMRAELLMGYVVNILFCLGFSISNSQ